MESTTNLVNNRGYVGMEEKVVESNVTDITKVIDKLNEEPVATSTPTMSLREKYSTAEKDKTSSAVGRVFLQTGLLTGLWFILNFLLSFVASFNTLLLKNYYVPDMYLSGNTLVICNSLADFLATATESILNANKTKFFIGVGLVSLVVLVSVLVIYKACQVVDLKGFKAFQIGLSVIFLGITSYSFVSNLKNSIVFMNEARLNNYIGTLNFESLQDLAMESNGATLEIGYDGLVRGIYKVNKEQLLATLIDGSTNWGVDFELPKEVEILNALFILSDVSDMEFIYELPEVAYVTE